ncbi:hypothetical protein WJX82_004322 [Trebouxia sp. C0006]
MLLDKGLLMNRCQSQVYSARAKADLHSQNLRGLLMSAGARLTLHIPRPSYSISVIVTAQKLRIERTISLLACLTQVMTVNTLLAAEIAELPRLCFGRLAEFQVIG